MALPLFYNVRYQDLSTSSGHVILAYGSIVPDPCYWNVACLEARGLNVGNACLRMDEVPVRDKPDRKQRVPDSALKDGEMQCCGIS